MSLAESLGVKPNPAFDHAPCRKTDPDIFFPEQGSDPKGVRMALALCARCPGDVRRACAAEAVRIGAQHGIWAGVRITDRHRGRALEALERISGENVALNPWRGPGKVADSEIIADEIERMTRAGVSASDIAVRLGLSERTVVRYRSRLKAVAS